MRQPLTTKGKVILHLAALAVLASGVAPGRVFAQVAGLGFLSGPIPSPAVAVIHTGPVTYPLVTVGAARPAFLFVQPPTYAITPIRTYSVSCIGRG
jgi:hypothetical protein